MIKFRAIFILVPIGETFGCRLHGTDGVTCPDGKHCFLSGMCCVQITGR
jgi:hypothetical protein